MSRILAAALSLLPAIALAQVAPPPPMVAARMAVNASAGDQSDPHVSEDLVAYTDGDPFSLQSRIRFFNLATGVGGVVPQTSGFDYLSDVSGRIVVYTHVDASGSNVYVYDTLGAEAWGVNVQPGASRERAAIGGHRLVWEDRGLSPTGLGSDIVTTELQTGSIPLALTQDDAVDTNPAVSSDGSVVVWTRCNAGVSDCHVMSWVALTGVRTALTSGASEERSPDTNGQVVVYSSVRSGSSGSDIYWQPASGEGPEERLTLDGDDGNPSISGNLIAFEHRAPGALQNDLFVYDLSSRALFQLTQTPESEELNDISVRPGVNGQPELARLVFAVNDTGDFNVYAYTLSTAAPQCQVTAASTVMLSAPVKGRHHEDRAPEQDDDASYDEALDEACAHPGDLPLLAELDLVRKPGAPQTASQVLPATVVGNGLLCVENGHGGSKATAGWVLLGGVEQVGPARFTHRIGRTAKAVVLAGGEELLARIAGRDGSAFRVRLYGPPSEDTCESTEASTVAALRLHQAGQAEIRTLEGKRIDPQETLAVTPISGAGCSSTGNGAAVAGLLVLIFGLLFPRPVPLPAPVRRRR